MAPLYKKLFPKQVKMSNESTIQRRKQNNNNNNNKKKTRKRNIVWVNPPYNKNVVTRVGYYFLKLLDKYFPRQHKLHKIFNKNSVKSATAAQKTNYQ